jgi:hypothetical protein
MAWPLVVVLVASLLGFIIVGVSNVVFYGIVREVNAASPDDRRMSFWKLGLKSRRVFKRHRELFPNSSERSKTGWLSAIGSLLFLGALIFGILATNAGWIKN